MNTNNNEHRESTDIIEVTPDTSEMVEIEMAGETDEVKRETKALIAALKRRAEREAESAGTLTRETYINAVRQAREGIEGEKLISRDRLENSWTTMQEETEKNWHLLVKEMTDFGDRLQSAAQAAWEAFNAPRS
ncbi:hypothetical protein [Nodularia chucula]|uniref:hypothetical protein n=1 Tax=Nodularia chucula TaxID=3093667 RepID=UPI0039C5F456